MNKIVVVIVAIIIISVGIIIGFSGPDLDKIIAEKDCNAVKSLTEDNLKGATTEQAMQLAALQASCIFGG